MNFHFQVGHRTDAPNPRLSLEFQDGGHLCKLAAVSDRSCIDSAITVPSVSTSFVNYSLSHLESETTWFSAVDPRRLPFVRNKVCLLYNNATDQRALHV